MLYTPHEPHCVSCEQKFQGEGPVKEEIITLDNFKIIEISRKFKTFLTQGYNNIPVLRINKNILKSIKIKVRRGKLKIGPKDPVGHSDSYEIYIITKNLDEIHLGDVVQLSIQKLFTTDNIHLHTKGSTKLKGGLISKTAIFKAYNGSKIQIKIRTKTLIINTKYHSKIKSNKFITTEVDFDIQDNTSVILNLDKNSKALPVAMQYSST
ncbi:MAG: DUF2807 domain-containing protein [Flavobacteriales bacterium]